MAAELGLDQRIAKRAGLLHDIGKRWITSWRASHISIGVDLLKKYNEPEAVINAIEAHHDDVEAPRSKPCWCKRPMRYRRRGPGLDAKCCKPMCSGWQRWKRSPSPS